MTTVFVAWGISAAVLLGSAALLGARVRQTLWGVFTDGRGRFSLSQMQVVLWTVLVVSLLVGVFVCRLADASARSVGALNFDIPSELLIVMGISLGSAAVATAIKTNKDT